MSNALIRKDLKFKSVPDDMIDDFKGMVFDSYFENYWHDLFSLATTVDVFPIYTLSLKETGDPFYYADDEKYEHLRTEDLGVLKEDVHALLNNFNIFHAERDDGLFGTYDFAGIYNPCVREVW